MLNWLQIPVPELFALLAAVAFAAGLNVYATVAVLGLMGHFGHAQLPPALQMLESWPLIVASAALFGVEFFADKIPAFDLVWNALHTFVRVPIAALIAYGATRHLSPGEQLVAALLGAGIALAAHGGKTALRAVITPSPEPISNISLSLGEDVAAVGLTWFAARHPYGAGAMALVMVVAIVLLARFVIRAVKSLFRGAENQMERAA